MDFVDLPLTTYLLILFGLLVLTIIFGGLKMPKDHTENQKMRALIRKKLILKKTEEQSGAGSDNAQGS